MIVARQGKLICGVCSPLALFAALAALATAAEPAKNLFTNPGFELGRVGWELSTGGQTQCKFTVDEQAAASGQTGALLTVGAIEEWGVQFGQAFAAGRKGRTYTFSVFARAVEGPAAVSLQIERRGPPYDRAAAGEPVKLTGQWRELHLTFTVDKDFPEGWFAYLSCRQPQVRIQADTFRLGEGPYEPYQEVEKREAEVAGVRLFDTGAALPAEPDGKALAARAGWVEVAEDDLAHRFQGDAVLLNDRLACVLARGAAGVAVYTLDAGGPARRAALIPMGGAGAGTLSTVAIEEINPGAGALKAAFAAPGGGTLALRYELKMGQPFIQTEALSATACLRVEAPCRFAVLPDFFADDIVIDAAELSVASAELPGDNFMLHLLPGGQAMVMTVRKTADEDVRVTLAGQGQARTIAGSEMRYVKDEKIWVGVLAAPAIWHCEPIAREQAGQVIAPDWKPPFPAQWRVDWRRADNHLTDSWEMVVEQPGGGFTKQGLFGEPETLEANRTRWTTVLGRFNYPAWLDRGGRAYLQPLDRPALRFQGPALIYPIGRAPATALGDFTVVDIMRNTLGVGPCEYILDVEGQQSAYKGRATCAVRDTLNPIYDGHQQRPRRAEIERTLDNLMVFIKHIRGRIEGYVVFGHELRAYLDQQKKAHPELAAPLDELDALAGTIDASYAARKGAIKTPDAVAGMVADFRRRVLDDTGEGAAAECHKFTKAWVEVGGNQDELVGECRWAVRMLRQRAGLLPAADPRLAEVAREIRRRSQAALRSPAGHEGATH